MTQAFAAPGAAAGDDPAATLGAHPFAKTMIPFALDTAGLIGSLHPCSQGGYFPAGAKVNPETRRLSTVNRSVGGSVIQRAALGAANRNAEHRDSYFDSSTAP